MGREASDGLLRQATWRREDRDLARLAKKELLRWHDGGQGGVGGDLQKEDVMLDTRYLKFDVLLTINSGGGIPEIVLIVEFVNE